jgi:hypothetical protein
VTVTECGEGTEEGKRLGPGRDLPGREGRDLLGRKGRGFLERKGSLKKLGRGRG